MNTKYLMISSSLVMSVLGLLALFLPEEILKNIQVSSTGFGIIFMQIIGALYLGFALMNWMAKTVLIGGIYARPLSMGNFFHFMVGALTLIKTTFSQPGLKYVWIPCIIYSLFAICFGIVAFTSPTKTNASLFSK